MTQRYCFVLSRPVGASLEAFSQALLGPTAKALERFRPLSLSIDVALPPDSGAALNAKREGDGAILSGLVSATLADGRVEYFTNYIDLRSYTLFSRRYAIALRAIAGVSTGKEPQRFNLSGYYGAADAPCFGTACRAWPILEAAFLATIYWPMHRIWSPLL